VAQAEERPKAVYPKVNRNARAEFSVLDRIVETKRIEIAELRGREAAVRAAAAVAEPAPPFVAALVRGPCVAVIAEVKRRSPSAGDIRGGASAAEVAAIYAAAGAAAISVLTDRVHFGGELADLQEARRQVTLPLLRKDFTLDALQVYEAKAAGASAVLLIVRLLDDAQLADLAALAAELGLAALVEVHDERELERAADVGARLIGINNRDLATLRTDLGTTLRLAPLVPRECVLIGESGIGSAQDVALLAAAGVSAVLVGESLMRAEDPIRLASSLAAVPRWDA
jgi:indole-3-glycerol phosphate synthase